MDPIHPFTGATSGLWVLQFRQFIPAGGLTANLYFVVNNAYAHGGPHHWAIQMKFGTNGMVTDDFRPETPRAVVFDRWVEIRIEIDLGANTQTTWYDGVLLSTGDFQRSSGAGSGGPVEIANIELCPHGSTSYYDDFALATALPPVPTPVIDLAQPGGAGTDAFIHNSGLLSGNEYYNILSVTPCPGGPGTGLTFGLCIDISVLLNQLLLPVGAVPFHFVAPTCDVTFGPYPAPSSSITIEGLTIDVTNGQLQAVSTVDHLVFQ